MKRISRKERKGREVFPNEDLKDANKQLRCNVDVNDDDDCLRNAIKLISHRNLRKHRKARRYARAASGVIAFSLTQTSQKTQTIKTLQYNQRDLDKNSQKTHTQACAGLRGDWLLAISF